MEWFDRLFCQRQGNVILWQLFRQLNGFTENEFSVERFIQRKSAGTVLIDCFIRYKCSHLESSLLTSHATLE